MIALALVMEGPMRWVNQRGLRKQAATIELLYIVEETDRRSGGCQSTAIGHLSSVSGERRVELPVRWKGVVVEAAIEALIDHGLRCPIPW